MTVKELKTGMFGMDTNGEAFVIADDKVIFEGGKYNDINDLDENLMFYEDDGIAALYEARCFQQVKDGRGKLIWKRDESREEEDESEDGVVTITEDEFFEVVKKANEKFMEISKKCPTPHDGVLDLALGMQNMTFGALVSAVLFNREIK